MLNEIGIKKKKITRPQYDTVKGTGYNIAVCLSMHKYNKYVFPREKILFLFFEFIIITHSCSICAYTSLQVYMYLYGGGLTRRITYI